MHSLNIVEIHIQLNNKIYQIKRIKTFKNITDKVKTLSDFKNLLSKDVGTQETNCRERWPCKCQDFSQEQSPLDRPCWHCSQVELLGAHGCVPHFVLGPLADLRPHLAPYLLAPRRLGCRPPTRQPRELWLDSMCLRDP